MVGIARVTTIMARESTKRGSIATQSTIQVPQRVLRDEEVRRKAEYSVGFRPTMDTLVLSMYVLTYIAYASL